MKIALILETSGGGSGRHVLDLAARLAAEGHLVTVFWSPLRAENRFVERLRALDGVAAVKVALRRSVGPHDLLARRTLRSALLEHGPFDVLHGHSSKAGALIRLMPRSVPGLRVYTPHALRTMDPDISRLSGMIFGIAERLLALGRAPIIAVSEEERRHALRLGIASDRLSVVANGLDPTPGLPRAAARATFGATGDEFVVGFIGRMVAQKDPLRFVEAVRLAAAQVPELRAVMMGDGPEMARVRAQAAGAPITLLGWCDAPSLIRGLDVLCVTSRYEALPYSFLEALHAGVPIVSTAVGGVEETILDGQTGLVLPVDAPAAEIAEALVAVLSNAELRCAYSAASRDLAAQRTVESMTRATLDIYRRGPVASRPSLQPAVRLQR